MHLGKMYVGRLKMQTETGIFMEARDLPGETSLLRFKVRLLLLEGTNN